MKVIISHDVDHIDTIDHLFKDLILEKMFVRSFVELFQGKISFKTFGYRTTILFHRRMNRIKEVMEFDTYHKIPSVFFFGMDNTLGMSYSRKKAKKYIDYVMQNGFDVGVHGCNYDNYFSIKKEYKLFAQLANINRFGIRTHYVRFDQNTFEKFGNAGYLFDTRYFNKKETELINQYKVGDMWEFPLHIMDVYVCKQGDLQKGIENTIRLINEAENRGIKYLTILFHDYQFDEVFDPVLKKWYEMTVEYCENNGYSFISYRDAILELENERNV